MSATNPLPREIRVSPTYACDGVNATFGVPFWFLDALDLLIEVTSPTDLVQSFSDGVGYSATGVGNPAGGSVIMDVAPADGSTLRVLGLRTAHRATSVYQGGMVNGDALDLELDAITATLQEQRRDIDRSAGGDFAALAESAADRAQAWAESATEPDGVGTKSAKTSALEAAEEADDAAAAAIASTDARDTAQEWAESPIEPGDPGTKSSKTWAGVSEGHANDAEAAKLDAETARDAAFANADVYADIATGRADVADGEQFMVVVGAEIVRYERVDSSNQTEVARYPTSDAFDENSVALIKREIAIVTGTVNVVMSDDNTFERTAGTATFIGQFAYTVEDLVERDAGRPITLRVLVSGAFSDTPDYQEFNAGGAGIGARVDMTLVGSEYVVTFTPNAAAVAVRIRWGATAAATMKRPYVLYQGQRLANQNTASWLRTKEKWANDVAELSGDLFGAAKWVAGVGVGGRASNDGRLLAVPVGVRLDANIPCRGVLQSGDAFTLVGELVANPGFKIRSIAATPHTGLGGGGGTALFISYRHDGLFIITGSAAGAAAANPAYIILQIDNRTLDATYTAADVKVQIHALFRGTISPHKLTDMALLRRALTSKRYQVGRVDPDAVAATKNVYANLVDALRLGHREIYLTGDQHYRCLPGLSINRDTAIIWRPGTQGETNRPIISAALQLGPGDWTATAADPNVYYYPLATTPARLYEVSGGVATRMGVEVAAPTLGAWRIGASEAEVRSTIGNFWWGAGSEGTGVYQRPFGDTLVGKTWEVPRGGRSLEITNCRVRLESVDARYAVGNTIYASGGVLETENIVTGRGGNNGCQIENGCHWIDIGAPSLATDAGNDGWGINSFAANPVRVTLGRTRAIGNVHDGFAPHGDFVYFTSIGTIYAQGNGKQGFVTIIAGDFDFDIESIDNRDVDVLFQLGSAAPQTTLRARYWLAGSISLTHNTASKITGRIEHAVSKNTDLNFFGRNVNVDVGRITANGDNYSGAVAPVAAVIVTGGVGKIEWLDIRRFATGISLSGGTLNLGGGNLLRNTTGILQSGGTLGVDLNRPLNVYGNGTQFSGVSAGDQAKTISAQVP